MINTDICHAFDDVFLLPQKHSEHRGPVHWVKCDTFVLVVGSSSSSSRDEYYLGGTIAMLLQDHRTMSTIGSL